MNNFHDIELLVQQPGRRTIFFHDEDCISKTVNLLFPYIIFAKKKWSKHLFLTFSNTGSLELDSTVYFPALPNIYCAGNACISVNNIPHPFQLKDLVNLFWNTSFIDPFIASGEGWPGSDILLQVYKDLKGKRLPEWPEYSDNWGDSMGPSKKTFSEFIRKVRNISE